MDVLTRHRLRLLDLDPEALAPCPACERVTRVYRRFLQAVPYENFSALARRRERPAQPSTWPRGTDRLLDDVAHAGLGGTCFSMAYALADLFRGVGANAHTALGQHLKKEEPHAVVIVYGEDGPRLYDPSFFVGDGIPVWPGATIDDGIFQYVLEPRCGPLLVLVQVTRAGERTRCSRSCRCLRRPTSTAACGWRRSGRGPRGRDGWPAASATRSAGSARTSDAST